MTSYLITAQGALSAACWVILAVGATMAVFSKQVHDTVTERIMLAAIAFTATGTACRIIKQGWISEGGFWLSISLAGYVLAIIWKKWHRIDDKPKDKQ